jgi:hypothetical protein
MSFWDRFYPYYSSFIDRVVNVSWILQFLDKIGSASSSNDGFMSASDKGNLDGVLAGTVVPPVANYANSAGTADGANYANQLQSFVNDDFTSGDHFIKAIREDGWWTRLKTCFNGGAYTSTQVRVGYADNAGYASSAGSVPGAITGTIYTKIINVTGTAIYANLADAPPDRYIPCSGTLTRAMSGILNIHAFLLSTTSNVVFFEGCYHNTNNITYDSMGPSSLNGHLYLSCFFIY